MKIILALTILVSSLSAQALQVQTLIVGTGEFNQTSACGGQTEHEAKSEALASVEAQCENGTVTQITEFGKVVVKPVTTFCYPTMVTAVFECTQSAQSGN